MRRLAMLALSLSLILGVPAATRLRAQDAKKDETKKDAPAAQPEEKKDEPAAKTAEPAAAKPAESAPKPIPPEVEAKLAAARKAVAEAIVAAQDAGLVDTSIDPPPILDILITGRATDGAGLKARTGVSPEVFGAWFTGYGKAEGVNPQTDVRIIQPSGGLKAWYDQRAAFLNREIEAIRKTKPAPAPAAETPAPAPAPTPAPEPKPEEKKPEAKPEEKKADEPKKEEAKPEEKKADEPKKEEAKPAEPKKEEAKPAEPKADEPKKEEAKPSEPKAEEKKAEEPKPEEKK